MRHRVADKKFNRDSNQRKALLMGLLRNLTERGEITTTQAKAKVLKRLADKLVHKAQDDTLATRRGLHRVFGKRDVVSTLVDRVAPAMSDRTSGFTRITPVGNRRGDNTPMVKISFVKQAEVTGTLKSGKTHPVRVKAAKQGVADGRRAATKSVKAEVNAPAKSSPEPKKAASKVVAKPVKQGAVKKAKAATK